MDLKKEKNRNSKTNNNQTIHLNESKNLSLWKQIKKGKEAETNQFK